MRCYAQARELAADFSTVELPQAAVDAALTHDLVPTPSGRWRLRAEGSSGGDGADQPCAGLEEEGRQVLDTWAAGLRRAGAAAPRFKVQRGQAMLMDNYRWLHAREPDNGCGGRLFWRSWIWTRHRLHAARSTSSPAGRAATLLPNQVLPVNRRHGRRCC